MSFSVFFFFLFLFCFEASTLISQSKHSVGFTLGSQQIPLQARRWLSPTNAIGDYRPVVADPSARRRHSAVLMVFLSKPRCSFHTTNTLQSNIRSRITSIYALCQCSASGLVPDLPLSPQVIQ